jgi:predicted nuclease with TOPRIM domain
MNEGERIHMREQLQARLATLQHEFEIGQTRLNELDQQRMSLQETLLRISGAIQVLSELLAVPNEEQSARRGKNEHVAES